MKSWRGFRTTSPAGGDTPNPHRSPGKRLKAKLSALRTKNIALKKELEFLWAGVLAIMTDSPLLLGGETISGSMRGGGEVLTY